MLYLHHYNINDLMLNRVPKCNNTIVNGIGGGGVGSRYRGVVAREKSSTDETETSQCIDTTHYCYNNMLRYR